jgi:hypothetical protein
MRRPTALASLLTSLFVSVFGCSEDSGSKVTGQPSAGGSESNGSGTSNGGNPLTPRAGSPATGATGGTSGVIPTEACEGLPIDLADDSQAGAPAESAAGAGGASDEACRGISQSAASVPVDLFIMMDRSQSMGFVVEGSSMTRWQALRDAVESFALDPNAAAVRAGIGFFSLSGSSNEDQECDAASYAEPAVPIGLLSETGAELVAAMDAITPQGLTPTVPALEGAIEYARGWAAENSDRATLVVLVSDGYPTQCSTSPAEIAAAAKVGYDSAEHVRTYVIGVGEVAKFNLDNYARAGGTNKAFLTEAGDVSASFVQALGNITDSKLSCEYQLPTPPDGMKLDTKKVQVVYRPEAGSAEEVPSVPSLAACANTESGGWYYDDPGKPSKISVCPCTCARFAAGSVEVRLGCKPRLGIR